MTSSGHSWLLCLAYPWAARFLSQGHSVSTWHVWGWVDTSKCALRRPMGDAQWWKVLCAPSYSQGPELLTIRGTAPVPHGTRCAVTFWLSLLVFHVYRGLTRWRQSPCKNTQTQKTLFCFSSSCLWAVSELGMTSPLQACCSSLWTETQAVAPTDGVKPWAWGLVFNHALGL